MDFSSLLEHFDYILSWKFLVTAVFLSYAFLGLYFVPWLHDILHDMFNYIVYSCIGFSLLLICKIGFLLQELISWKRTLERQEQSHLDALLNLSKSEAAVMKYLFLRPNHSAWLPPDMPDTSLLLHKGYIEVIVDKRKSPDPLNFYTSEKDSLYTLTENTLITLNKHKDDFMTRWKKVKIDKLFDKYQ